MRHLHATLSCAAVIVFSAQAAAQPPYNPVPAGLMEPPRGGLCDGYRATYTDLTHGAWCVIGESGYNSQHLFSDPDPALTGDILVCAQFARLPVAYLRSSGEYVTTGWGGYDLQIKNELNTVLATLTVNAPCATVAASSEIYVFAPWHGPLALTGFWAHLDALVD